MRFTDETLAAYMEHWDDATRRAIQERLEHRSHQEQFSHFSDDEAALLRALLARMIPLPEGEEVDFVGFLDAAIERPLRPGEYAGLLPAGDLIRVGLIGVQEAALLRYGRAFVDLSVEQQDAVVAALQEGAVIGEIWRRIPAQEFLEQLLMKALSGYCTHPLAWGRMGYLGVSCADLRAWLRRHPGPPRRRKTGTVTEPPAALRPRQA